MIWGISPVNTLKYHMHIISVQTARITVLWCCLHISADLSGTQFRFESTFSIKSIHCIYSFITYVHACIRNSLFWYESIVSERNTKHSFMYVLRQIYAIADAMTDTLTCKCETFSDHHEHYSTGLFFS